MSDDCIITQTVLAALRHHPTRSVRGCELKLIAGGTDRQVRASISELRRLGWLVVGNWSRGYHFASDEAEVEEVAHKLEEQARALVEIARMMRESATRYGFMYDRRGGNDGFSIQG